MRAKRRLRESSRRSASERRPNTRHAPDDPRIAALTRFVANTATINSSRRLIEALVEELHVEDDFQRLLGEPRRLPKRRYPQAVAVALAIRRSWRRDVFDRFARRLGIQQAVSRMAKAVSD